MTKIGRFRVRLIGLQSINFNNARSSKRIKDEAPKINGKPRPALANEGGMKKGNLQTNVSLGRVKEEESARRNLCPLSGIIVGRTIKENRVGFVGCDSPVEPTQVVVYTEEVVRRPDEIFALLCAPGSQECSSEILQEASALTVVCRAEVTATRRDLCLKVCCQLGATTSTDTAAGTGEIDKEATELLTRRDLCPKEEAAYPFEKSEAVSTQRDFCFKRPRPTGATIEEEAAYPFEKSVSTRRDFCFRWSVTTGTTIEEEAAYPSRQPTRLFLPLQPLPDRPRPTRRNLCLPESIARQSEEEADRACSTRRNLCFPVSTARRSEEEADRACSTRRTFCSTDRLSPESGASEEEADHPCTSRRVFWWPGRILDSGKSTTAAGDIRTNCPWVGAPSAPPDRLKTSRPDLLVTPTRPNTQPCHLIGKVPAVLLLLLLIAGAWLPECSVRSQMTSRRGGEEGFEDLVNSID